MPEIRDPLYGMVTISPLEWDVIQSQPFQRLRRIKQLAFSDFIYPGAVHTRFEHSIGVMHLASEAFDRIMSKPQAASALGYDEAMTSCARRAIRLAALVHDLGHLPFSHAGEEVLPSRADGSKYEHEEYTDSLIRAFLEEVISTHPENSAHRLSADEIADFLSGRVHTPRLAKLAPWRALLIGQLDADRVDYLRRDSHHLGVEYGRFDVERILSTLTLVQEPETQTGDVRLGVEEGGLLAVESLILARYYMFHQVYYHRVRRYLDHLYAESFKRWLVCKGKDALGRPDIRGELEYYLQLDDWTMQSEIRSLAKSGCEVAQDLLDRKVMKVLFEIDGADKAALMEGAQAELNKRGVKHWRDSGSVKETHKFVTASIMVLGETSFQGVRPISTKSRIAMAIPPRIYIERLYVEEAERDTLTREKWLKRLRGKGEKIDERRSKKIAKA